MKTVLAALIVVGAASVASAADVPTLKADHKEDVEKQLMAVERRWNEALKDRDAGVLSGLCSEEFILTGEDGKILDRKRYIGDATTRLKVTSYTTADMTARSYGDTGVVNGLWAGLVVFDGHGAEMTVRFTDTFVRREGKWWAVASQMSRVQEDGAPQQDAKLLLIRKRHECGRAVLLPSGTFRACHGNRSGARLCLRE